MGIVSSVSAIWKKTFEACAKEGKLPGEMGIDLG